MNTKNNARSKESIEKIKLALVYFIKKGVDINNLSIQKLCDKAGLYRATFYAHFDIIDDVLYLIQKESLLKAFELLHNKSTPIEQRVLNVISLLDDGGFAKQLFLNTHHIDLRISDILKSNDLFHLMRANSIEQVLVIDSIISAVTGVLKLYFLDSNKYPKEVIAKTILHIIKINQLNFPN